MKTKLLAGAILSTLFFGHCSFFNFKPVDALAGREAGYVLATAAAQGWFAGASLYSGVKPLNVEFPQNDTLSGNTALIYELTPGFAGIQSDRFYRRSAISACESRVFTTSLAVTFSLFDGGPLFPDNDTIFAAAVASSATASVCTDMEAGEYLDLAPLPLAY